MAKTKMLKTLRKPQPRARSPILDYDEFANGNYEADLKFNVVW